MKVVKTITIIVLALGMLAGDAAADSDDRAMHRHDDPPRRHEMPSIRSESPELFDESKGNSRCVSNTEGFFGDSSNNGLALEYLYELDYDTHVLPRIDHVALKVLENKISDALLPILFERACSNSRRDLEDTLRRRLEVIGISSLPDDVVLPEVRCSSRPSGRGIACSVALGRVSIFALAGAAIEHEGPRALLAIEAIMNNGAFNGSVPGLTDVRFVNGTYSLGLDTAVTSASGSTMSYGNGGLEGYAIALIVIAAVGVVGVALSLAVRRKKKKDTQRREMSAQLGQYIDEIDAESTHSQLVDVDLD